MSLYLGENRMIKFIAASLVLFSLNSYASNCPTSDFVGEFRRTQIIGCQKALAHVSGAQNRLMSDGTLEYGLLFNGDLLPQVKFYISPIMKSSQIDCSVDAGLKFWRWYPQIPRSEQFWGIAKHNNEIYAEVGPDCSYRLERK